jgi:hypothetical protein
MNKKEKVFIINNQEDEDGYNLNPGNSILTENVKSSLQMYPPGSTADKNAGDLKLHDGGLLFQPVFLKRNKKDLQRKYRLSFYFCLVVFRQKQIPGEKDGRFSSTETFFPENV